MPMRGSQSESGVANGERSGPPWGSRPGLRKQSLGNWHSWKSAQGPMDRMVTSMSSAVSRRRSWRPGQAWHTPSGGHHREDVLGPRRRRMALAPWSDFLELCCLGSALGPRGDPQRNLRHLAANAACSPAPLTRPEEQGEDACRAEGLQECHQRGQFLLQRVGHQVLAAPGCWLISAGVPRDGEIPCCPNVPHALPCHRHGPPHSGHPRLQSPPSGESNLRWEDRPAALCL